MKKLIFSFIVVATAILVSCNEEFEEVTTIDIPNYRDGVYSGDNLTFTVDGEPRTVNSVTISSRQVGNDTLYSDNLKKATALRQNRIRTSSTRTQTVWLGEIGA